VEQTVQTLPQLLLQNYKLFGDRQIAMLKKDFGIWKVYTWKDSYEHVKYFCLGLMKLGLKAGDKVAIMGDNDPQWYWAEWAVQSAKAAIYGIYADTVANEVKYLLKNGDASFVICSDQEQIDKVIEVKSELELFKKMIYWKPKGIYYYTDPDILFWEDVERLGREYEKSNPSIFESLIERGVGEDIATLCYTSGTTGEFPKGALISHRSLIANMRNFVRSYPLGSEDVYVSSASPAWLAEQWFGLTCHVLTGLRIAFPESASTLMTDLRDIGPTIVFFPTRIWEQIASNIKSGLNDTSWWQRRSFELLLPLGEKCEKIRNKNRLWEAIRFFTHVLMFRPLRDRLGLKECHIAFQGGAMISSEGMRFFRNIGLNLKQLYASTEGGLLAMHREGEEDPETLGSPPDSNNIKVNEDGEVISRGEIAFSGYYKNEEAFKKAVTDGWFHTGDAVILNERGHYIYLDRVKNLYDLPGGHKFAPEYVSSRLRFNPYIKDALVIGGGSRPFISAVIILNYENVGDWAAKKLISYSTYVDLSQKPEVYDLIKEQIEGINQTLPTYMQVSKFVNLHKEFDADEAEMTRTRKLRRGLLEDRYSNLIDAIYGGEDSFSVEAPVTYRDGRTGVIRTNISIKKAKETNQ
jgi:long-chain acyl-CoA synthetase